MLCLLFIFSKFLVKFKGDYLLKHYTCIPKIDTLNLNIWTINLIINCIQNNENIREWEFVQKIERYYFRDIDKNNWVESLWYASTTYLYKSINSTCWTVWTFVFYYKTLTLQTKSPPSLRLPRCRTPTPSSPSPCLVRGSSHYGDLTPPNPSPVYNRQHNNPRLKVQILHHLDKHK